jgi:hypothetical protein
VKLRSGALRRAARAAVLATAVTTPGNAKPQWNTGLESGLCGTRSSHGGTKLGWCNAAHGDVLFLRERGTDFGVGPSLRLGTTRFDDLRLDAGLSVLIPVLESFPLVLEAGPHLRNFGQPGVFASAFFGLRSFNHYGHYEMAGGLSLIAERSFTAGTPSALWITLRIDGELMAIPFVFAYSGLR